MYLIGSSSTYNVVNGSQCRAEACDNHMGGGRGSIALGGVQVLGESCNCFCPDIRLSQAFLSRTFVPLVCEESIKSENCLVNGAGV